MKLLALALALPMVLATALAKEAVFTPYRISYDDLMEDSSFEMAREAFIDTLQAEGVVSVTGIPSLHKLDTLAFLHACAIQSKTTQEHTYADGTLRRTMATHSVPGGVQRMLHYSSACRAFEEASTPFRRAVADVTHIFSQRLASLLRHNGPLLSTEHGYNFDTIQDVVEAGEHLEHFHSYQKDATSTSKEETIDFHIDQGLFLVFSPALLIQDSSILGTLKEGFYVQRQDGTRARVDFDNQDDLVFLLGDGVNQYINPKLTNKIQLRATPHAVSMHCYGSEKARVWYGRMVLPPADALHPVHGKSFGNLRDSNIQGEHKDLACSSDMVARQLETTACEADTIFCWAKCMSPSEYNVSESICQEQGLNLTCTNEERQLYVSGHGNFFPGCIDISNAEEVYGNPNHPSQQNNTNSTDGSQSHDGMTSGVAVFHSIATLVAMTALVGFF